MKIVGNNAEAGKLKAGTNWKANNFLHAREAEWSEEVMLVEYDRGVLVLKVQSFAQCTVSKVFHHILI